MSSGILFRLFGSQCSVAGWTVLTAGWVVAQNPTEYHDRADQALQSFLLKFWNGSAQYLRQDYPDTGSLTGYWTYANGWEAVLDGVERTGGQQYYGLVESFYRGQDRRGWYSGWYDDECWMTMALLRSYEMTGDPVYLSQAEVLYADVRNGWDVECCGVTPGGVWWDKAHTQKATAANAGAALVGARLYRLSGDLAYLDFAQQVYTYWLAHMVNTTSYQVCDHIEPDGDKVWWRFTYNEGLMIGAAVELYEATGAASYLSNAHRIVGFLIRNEVQATTYGNVLHDGDRGSCLGDCTQFKGPAYRHLMRLHALDPRAAYENVLRASADAVWNLARNPSSTVFSVDWSGPYQASADQGEDNSACTALSRYAQQVGVYPGSGIPGGRYEAENATVVNVHLEALYGGFTGWGYVAAWNQDGQRADFRVQVPSAGPYTITLRYAGGAGDARRLIQVDGVNVVRALLFPGTGSWTVYDTVSFEVDLEAGGRHVAIIYAAAQGSANWLNLDNLTVSGVAAEPPSLAAQWAGEGLDLAWPAEVGGYAPYQATSLRGRVRWTRVTGTPTVVDGLWWLSVPISSETQYYRLRAE